MKKINVILSGGVGSRLWPLSRKSRPKQYLPIFDGNTLFQKTAKRNSEFCDEILVVGNCENFELSRKDLESSEIEQYKEIIEACPRNTAAAIAFAAFQANPEDILFVTPSDHLIESGAEYKKAIKRAIELAKNGFIVTFGLNAKKPETGFGYIEAEGEEVKSFREKPNKETAEAFIKAGNFYWNSGMFCFQAGVFLEELKAFEPEVYEKSKLVFDKSKDGFLDLDLSMQIPSISVDYAVMERTKKIKVVPSYFSWSDMGSFESIYDYFKKQGHSIDSKGNMVIGTDIHTEFTGLKNTILVHTSDAILVLKKDNAQDVKKVFERLEKEKPQIVS
ncbi:mannose-1-phosphate guanylyltransferase [Algoriphagus machipongonensis]|uniref:ATP phosphoribosyltransferase n=1 Tax=Algoriphagus machipongonensis TaxID=388413 RepID=A3HRP9_9BACT|nr:sugar phosphate nucleotidyltransferase [Algoriphagus machipongonensis]EAZ82517.1 ATP phosphoribosyltransferase [Algoriphagus machipongonensis]